MSKKTLRDGLESLFGMTSASVEEETAFMGDNVLPEGKKGKKTRQRASSNTRTRSGGSKSFTADLESLFQTVVKESVAEERKKAAREKQRSIGTPVSDREISKVRRPMGGLDALIRQTVEPNKEQILRAAVPKEKKRVTFVFDKTKLLKLKTIAKLEKAYLKDIIGGLISGYLDDYDLDDKKTVDAAK